MKDEEMPVAMPAHETYENIHKGLKDASQTIKASVLELL